MNDSIFKLIQNKCQDHELLIAASVNDESLYFIANWERTKSLDLQIITPSKYMPEKKEAPYDIETACSFKIPAETFREKPDFLIFCYQEESIGKTSFLIIQTMELMERFEKMSRQLESDGTYELTIYAGPDDYIQDTTGISGEGEWYFFGGRMATGKNWDFSMYLNQWDAMFDYFLISLP